MNYSEVPTIRLTDGFSGEFEIEISRKDKKVWGRILQMPKYKITEWMFPRKKKRGTIKRKRRQSKKSAAAMIRALRRAMMRFGVTAEQASEEIKKLFQRIQQHGEIAEMMHREDVPGDAPNFSK